MILSQYPDFTYTSYKKLLKSLKNNYLFMTTKEIGNYVNKTNLSKVVLMRHDVDFSVKSALEIARIDAENGIKASFFFGLNMPYNLFSKSNKEILRHILSLGHEIGFHYDLSAYSIENVYKEFENEINILSDLIEEKVVSAVMHCPSFLGEDLIADYKGIFNPFSKSFWPGSLYISDSCRAWRDDKIANLNQGEIICDKLILNFHPILWSEQKVRNRFNYLQEIMFDRLDYNQDNFISHVEPIWRNHAGGKAYDQLLNEQVNQGNNYGN